MQRYLIKAIKEAKVNSSWIQPNEEWENAVTGFIANILEANHPFRAQFEPAAKRISWHGMLNSMTQTILKLTAPGVPDIYQGSELWDLSLVDPDNRRPVDYAHRAKILEEIENEKAESLCESWQDGRIKMFVTRRLLHLRRTAPLLFQKGSYASFYGDGEFADCCISFSRELNSQRILVIAPRFTTRLRTKDEHLDWKKTELLFDSGSGAMKDLFTERTIAAGLDSIPLENLREFPFAVFHNLKGL